MLKGDADLDPSPEEGSQFDAGGGLIREPLPVAYNPAIPVEYFDVIFIDECHRSIYSLWRQVLEYFDAHLIGLTATPSKQTFGFFNQNLVMEYGHEEAVADRVNVDFDLYRIRTRITERGSTIEAGPYEAVGRRDRETRAVRLPTGIFYAQGVKANVLFFDRKPASETPWTRQLWIYDLRTNVHFTLKTNPLRRSDLDDFVVCYRPENRHLRQPTWSEENPGGRWRAYVA